MPRIARGLLNGGIFHVLNRGNHRQMLFQQDEDFVAFLDLLACSVAKFDVQLWGYCLMGNHWHLIVEVPSIEDLSRWMHWLCNRLVRQLHSENAHLGGGHIYQGRFKSFPFRTTVTCITCCATWKPILRAPDWWHGRKTGRGQACPPPRCVTVWWRSRGRG